MTSSILLSFIVTNISTWRGYLLQVMAVTRVIDIEQYLAVPENIKEYKNVVYPQVIEGIKVIETNSIEIGNFHNSSFDKILSILQVPHSLEILVVGFIFTVCLFCAFAFKSCFHQENSKSLFLIATLICLIGEFFIPIARYPYYDIQWLLPLLILASQIPPQKLLSNKLIIILGWGFLLSTGCFSWLPNFLLIATFSIAFYTTVISFTVLPFKNQ